MRPVEIPLTKGLSALVSASDEHRLRQFRWHAVSAGRTHYAATRQGDKTIYMHRLILGIEGRGRDVFADHINHNGLDNTRENLRLASAAENARNRRTARSYLGLQGVRREGEKWAAQIRKDGRLIYLGSYDTEREAGIAYSAATKALYEAFAPEHYR